MNRINSLKIILKVKIPLILLQLYCRFRVFFFSFSPSLPIAVGNCSILIYLKYIFFGSYFESLLQPQTKVFRKKTHDKYNIYLSPLSESKIRKNNNFISSEFLLPNFFPFIMYNRIVYIVSMYNRIVLNIC